jgi:hypothetical protein
MVMSTSAPGWSNYLALVGMSIVHGRIILRGGVGDIELEVGTLAESAGSEALFVVAIEFICAEFDAEFLEKLLLNNTARVFVEPVVERFEVFLA